ncbi:MAG: Serine/threonine-protein phosphatase 1 [Promethearchaeota archaeon]|nr:MAG: Serine/threonine-protein phosphatase 1 [Candidatus Lokiarchaeota archaeon]
MVEKSFLQKIMKSPERISQFGFNKISSILKDAKALFEEESLILNLYAPDSDVFVIGDLHGNLESLQRIHAIIQEKNPKYVVFLGDIVDRGSYQIECLGFVLSLKILEPDKYFILRGNHETLQMNKYYGFYQDFNMRFGQEGDFTEILSLYNLLPICAIINDSTLCLHGGIPENMEILDQIHDLKQKELNYNPSGSVEEGIFQMLWNDPKEGLSGFMNSFRGEGIKFFGGDVLGKFLDKYELKSVIRAHEVFPAGYKWFFEGRLLSIFSSSNYRGQGSNVAAYARIEGDKIFTEIIE